MRTPTCLFLALLTACGQPLSPADVDHAAFVGDARQVSPEASAVFQSQLATLLDDPTWIWEIAPDAREPGGRFTPLDVLDAIDPESVWFAESDGHLYELGVELLPDAAGSVEIDQGYGLALDPDLGFHDEDTWTVYWDGDEQGPRMEALPYVEDADVALLHPTFVLTWVDVTPEDAGPSGPAQGACGMPTPAPTTYLCLCGLEMDDNHETGNAEFELHLESVRTSSYQVTFPRYSGDRESSSSSYQYIFNNGYRYDASGTRRLFNDVNDDDRLYCAAYNSGVALTALSSSCYSAILPMEDDNAAGEFRGATGAAASYAKNCSSTNNMSASRAALGRVQVASPSSVTNDYGWVQYANTGGDDSFEGYFRGFRDGTVPTSYPGAYTAGDVTLYLMQGSNCQSACSTWISSSGCHNN